MQWTSDFILKINHILMNEKDIHSIQSESLPLRLTLRIGEDWLARYLKEESVIVPISDQQQLSNLTLTLSPGKIFIEGELTDKESTFIAMSCVPHWQTDDQKFTIDNLQVQTRSKNILVKSAGWFAQTFMMGKMDARIEQTANQLYTAYVEKIIALPLVLPIPIGGFVHLKIMEIWIESVDVMEKSIEIKTRITGDWELSLTTAISDPTNQPNGRSL